MSLPKSALFLPASLIFFALPGPAFASTSVNISGNANDSTNQVSVNNTVFSSVNSGIRSNSQTDIRIDTNGQVKEYRGSSQDINLQSGSGNSSVSVSNSINNSAVSTPAGSGRGDENSKVTPPVYPSPALWFQQSNSSGNGNRNFNLGEFVRQQIASIFQFFHLE